MGCGASSFVSDSQPPSLAGSSSRSSLPNCMPPHPQPIRCSAPPHAAQCSRAPPSTPLPLQRLPTPPPHPTPPLPPHALCTALRRYPTYAPAPGGAAAAPAACKPAPQSERAMPPTSYSSPMINCHASSILRRVAAAVRAPSANSGSKGPFQPGLAAGGWPAAAAASSHLVRGTPHKRCASRLLLPCRIHYQAGWPPL